MKSVTHTLFSAGLGFYLLSRIGVPSPLGYLLAIWLSLSINSLIDLGHSRRGGVRARSFVTHPVFTAPLWGAAIGAATIIFLGEFMNLGEGFSAAPVGLLTGVIIAYSHLLLDALTQAGVFLGRHRIALAHFSYDNPVLNLAFAMAGIVLLISRFL